jgi:hypothetical protein
MKTCAQPRRGMKWLSYGAIWLCALAANANAENPLRNQTTLPGGRPIGGFRPAHLAAQDQPAPRTVAAKSKTVTVPDDVVDGGTYYENERGELVLDKAPGRLKALPDGAEFVDGACDTGCLVPCCGLPTGSLEVFSGVQAFTGPVNRGGSGSFGFHQGVNWGMPLTNVNDCLAAQIGFRATESNLSGAAFTNDSRFQGFVTAGLFRRVDCGLQGGVVIDWMSDSWYRETDLTAIRGEASWVYGGVHDLGFWFTAHSKSDTVVSTFDPAGTAVETWQPTDLYAFFYRMKFGPCDDGMARLFAGWTGDSDGLIGIDARIPLSNTWSLETNFAYLIPQQGAGTGLNAGHTQESWNISMALVWYPGRLWGNYDQYARPLLRVADNGTFMVDGF